MKAFAAISVFAVGVSSGAGFLASWAHQAVSQPVAPLQAVALPHLDVVTPQVARAVTVPPADLFALPDVVANPQPEIAAAPLEFESLAQPQTAAALGTGSPVLRPVARQTVPAHVMTPAQAPVVRSAGTARVHEFLTFDTAQAPVNVIHAEPSQSMPPPYLIGVYR